MISPIYIKMSSIRLALILFTENGDSPLIEHGTVSVPPISPCAARCLGTIISHTLSDSWQQAIILKHHFPVNIAVFTGMIASSRRIAYTGLQ
jgi:hypothetical protein